ncbi:MAG: PKD domain-containing protein [Bacteroidia bacterium]|nr:PKD domain-containing protein [Bacteroidia bacterium]
MKNLKYLHISKGVALLLGFILSLAFEAYSQYTFTSSATANVSSINSGSQFTYVFNYSTAGNTTTGINVVAETTLPDNLVPFNESNFNSNVIFPSSQITSVTYNSLTKKVTATFINPLPAGVTGQFELKLKYLNGTTPNGYAPDLFTKITFDNPGGPVFSDTLNIIANSSNKFTLSKIKNSGGAINDLSIFRLNISSSGSGSAALKLFNPILRDTLPLGVEFVEATSFSGSNPPTYDPLTRIVTWTWTAGEFQTNYSGTAYLSVRYLQPTYQIGLNACNSATLNGDIPVLPFGNQANNAKTGSVCFPIESPDPEVICNGGGITAATANWMDKHVLPGTSGNSFSNGWVNSGNTEIDSISLTYQIDKSVDVSVIRIGRLVDGLARTGRDTVQIRYKTNLNPAYTFQGTHIITADKNVTISLPSGEYLTEVNFVIYSKLPIGGSQSFTYQGTTRTAVLGAKDGSPIVEGITYLPLNVGDDGTVIYNTSQGKYYYNGIETNYSNCSGLAEIMIPRPVFNSPSKTITNGSSFKASDTINYRFSVQLGGNVMATNVVIVDTLDPRLTYVPGSSSITIGLFTIVPIVNGQTLVWNLGNLPANGTTYTINFKAVIAPGTPAASIPNSIKIYADDPSIFPRGTGDNESSTVVTAIALIAYKGQNGCDPGFVYYPINASTKEGDLINYKITVKNQGNVAAKDLTLIDVFPFIGDNRGSQWFANLVGPVELEDPSSVLYYNTVPNPCYADFTPAVNPSGCSAPNWSLTPPVNITSVTAIKIVRTTNLPALDSIVFNWPMRVPVGTPANLIMNNTIYYQVSRADLPGTTGRLLPAAPNQVGMITNCAPLLGSLGNYVWIDLNKNGLQDEPTNLGLNGVKVYLYGAGPDNQIGGGDDLLLDSTFTGNDFTGNPGYYKFVDLPSGNYYVKFQTQYEQFYLTPTHNQNAQLDGNNDANNNGISGLVTINALGSGVDKDNPTIDAGYYPIGSLGNYVWRDLNANGLQDEPSNLGINGKKVYLYKDNGSGFEVIDSAVTANDALGNPGYYNFIIELSGNYRVKFPTGGLTTQNNAAGVNGNSDANTTTGFTSTIVMNLIGTGVAVNNPTIDAGYVCSNTSSFNDAYICSGSSYLFNGTTYTAAGNYFAILPNAEGCDSTANLTLHVIDYPSSLFIVNNGNQCVNSNSYTFTVQHPQAHVLYKINYGNGNKDSSYLTSFNYTYAINGGYTVQLLAQDTLAGCSTQSSITTSVLPRPVPSLWQNDTARCLGGNVFTFQNFSTVPGGTLGNVTWYFGDGTDTTVLGNAPVFRRYETAGTFQIVAKVSSTDNCLAFDTLQVRVRPGPVAAFSLNQNGCCGDITVTNNSQNATVCEWTFASLSGNYLFTCTYTTNTFNVNLTPGTYRVRLIAKGDGDCVDTSEVLYTVLSKPSAVFAYTVNACASQVQFHSYSFGSNQYIWDFGDPLSGVNNSSSIQNPSHLFSGPGTYLVKLIVGNGSGCFDTISRAVIIDPGTGITPTASFTHSLVSGSCTQKVKFTSTSSLASSVIWLFHDGSMASEAVVNKTYSTPGTYTVKLVAISSTQCVDTLSQTIVISGSSNGPVALFNADEPIQCLVGNSYNFNNTSTYIGAGWNTNYQWDFGDGTFDNSNTFAFNKVYTLPGTYTVRLIAIGSNGCRDTAYQLIHVKESAVADFSTGNTCGTKIQITNTSINSLGNYWNMGDGGALCHDSTSFSHTYNTPGYYTVTMVNVAENGCIDSIQKGIIVNDGDLPVPSFTYSVNACSNAIQFNNTSENGGSYIWNFGDGSPIDSTTAPIHGYASSGTYNVQLTAYLGAGCSASITQSITAPQWSGIYPPKADYGYYVEPCTNTITATGNAIGNVSSHKWLWDGVLIGWGPSIVVPNPSVGGHTLSYVVGNAICFDTISKYFHIQENPVAGFELNSNTCSNTIMVTNASKNANSYYWDFGVSTLTNDTAVGATAIYTYANNGTYTIRLIAKDLYGCADTAMQSVIMTREFNANIANFTFDNSLCNCECQNKVKFENLTMGSNLIYYWTFGDGSSSVKASPTKGFGSAGIYQVTLVSIDSVGCMSSLTKPVEVFNGVNGPSASFNTDYQVQCLDNNNFNFYNTSTYMGSGWINKYYWYFGDGTMDSSNTFIFNKKYTSAGNYIVTLVAVGAEGCRDTMSMFIQVRDLPCTGVLKFVNLQDGSNWNIDPKLGDGGILNSVQSNVKTANFTMYPNPNLGNFSLQLTEVWTEPITLSILDVLGKEIFQQTFIPMGKNKIDINLEGISDGTYLIKLSSENYQYRDQKFVVIR